MCVSFGNYAADGAEAMKLDEYWHSKASWYGPSGIVTGGRIEGFRNWH
ncbi:MAG: hypothetical protein ACJASL_004877 [Paraglaciecola sp.]|jgi:hypothetical protein